MLKNQKLNFKIENFLRFKDVEYIVIDDLPTDVKSFKKMYSKLHRSISMKCLERGYRNFDDNDLTDSDNMKYLIQKELMNLFLVIFMHVLFGISNQNSIC